MEPTKLSTIDAGLLIYEEQKDRKKVDKIKDLQ